MRITRATTSIVGNPWKNRLVVRLDTDQPGLYGSEGTLNGFARTVKTVRAGSETDRRMRRTGRQPRRACRVVLALEEHEIARG